MLCRNPINRLFALVIVHQPDDESEFPKCRSSYKILMDLERILFEKCQEKLSQNVVFEIQIKDNSVSLRIDKVLYPVNIHKVDVNLRDIYDTFENTKLSEMYRVTLSEDGTTLTGEFKK